MDSGSFYIVSLAVGVACAFGGYFIAKGKNRNAGLWAVLGFLFGLIALIVIAVLPKKSASPMGSGVGAGYPPGGGYPQAPPPGYGPPGGYPPPGPQSYPPPGGYPPPPAEAQSSQAGAPLAPLPAETTNGVETSPAPPEPPAPPPPPPPPA